MRRPGLLAIGGVLLGTLLGTAAFAQATDYTSVDAPPGKPVELGNYAAIGRNCSAGAPPTIKIVEPPKSGTLRVQKGERVYSVSGCPPIKAEAEVMTYEAAPGMGGSDRIVYDIVGAAGQVSTKDVTLRLSGTAPQQQPVPTPKPDIKF